MDITHSPEIAMAKLDCAQNREFCQKKLVYGVPYIMAFVKGNEHAFYYNGPKTPEDIVVWIGSITGALPLLV